MAGYPTRLLMVMAMKNTSTISLTTHELAFIQSCALGRPIPIAEGQHQEHRVGQEMLRIGRDGRLGLTCLGLAAGRRAGGDGPASRGMSHADAATLRTATAGQRPHHADHGHPEHHRPNGH